MLDTSGDQAAPRFVYAWFRAADGTVFGSYAASIIYDALAPVSLASVDGAPPSNVATASLSALSSSPAQSIAQTVVTSGTITLQIPGQDDLSGLSQVQVSEQPDFAGATWQPYAARLDRALAGTDRIGTLYVPSRDQAGNISQVTSVPFILDTQAPSGSMVIDQPVVNTDTTSVMLYLHAEDDMSGVESMRISADPNFADAACRELAGISSPLESLTGREVPWV